MKALLRDAGPSATRESQPCLLLLKITGQPQQATLRHTNTLLAAVEGGISEGTSKGAKLFTEHLDNELKENEVDTESNDAKREGAKN